MSNKREIFMPNGQPYKMMHIVYWGTDDPSKGIVGNYIIAMDDDGREYVCRRAYGTWAAYSSMDLVMHLQRLDRLEGRDTLK